MIEVKHLLDLLPKKIQRVSFHGAQDSEITYHVKVEDFNFVLHFLRDHTTTLFGSLMDITAVDYPDRSKRFDVIYFLLSMPYNARIKVQVEVDEYTPLTSMTNLFSSAGWFEREVWDMFGIYFEGNNDLRRLLTDYGFEGHPLRKDFPLTGYVEVRYDEKEKRVLSEPVEIAQDFRAFHFATTWPIEIE